MESVESVEMAYDVYETPETTTDKCPIILCHGLAWNKYLYSELAEDLCKATKRKVYCVDLRCHGMSPFRQEFHADLIVEDVKRFIRDRKLDKVSFVCHSFSSTVAYLVAVDEPEHVEKIVMIDYGPFGEVSEANYKEQVLPQIMAQNRFLNSLDSSLSLSAARKKIQDLSKGAPTLTFRLYLQKMAYDLTKVNNKFGWKTDMNFLGEKFWHSHVTPRGRSDHEILIFRCPDSIRVTDERFASTLKYNPNAKLVTMEDTTHLLMFEKQEEFVEIVKDFLA